MEAEENRTFLEKLLAKREKLVELKNKITSQDTKEVTKEETAGDLIPQNFNLQEQPSISSKVVSPITKKIHNNNYENKSEGNSKPATPYSNAQPSISPPPYSPLTPLINKTKHENNLLVLKDKSLPYDSSPQDFSCSPTLLLNDKEISQPSSNASSPLRPMTPETFKVFNMLTAQVPIDYNIDDGRSSKDEDVVDDCCDSDDSVRDPNYSLHCNKETIIDDSATSCSSVDNSSIPDEEPCDNAEAAQSNCHRCE